MTGNIFRESPKVRLLKLICTIWIFYLSICLYSIIPKFWLADYLIKNNVKYTVNRDYNNGKLHFDAKPRPDILSNKKLIYDLKTIVFLINHKVILNKWRGGIGVLGRFRYFHLCLVPTVYSSCNENKTLRIL